MTYQYTCFTCNNRINSRNRIYKAYDKNFCSDFCRHKILNDYNYTHECLLIKRNKSVNSLNNVFNNNVIIKDNNIINDKSNTNNVMKRDISNLEKHVNNNKTCINTIVENYVQKYKINVPHNSLKVINDIVKHMNFVISKKN